MRGRCLTLASRLERALDLALGVALLHGIALVVELLATRKGDLHLDKALIVEIHLQRNDGEPLFLSLLLKVSDLLFMQEQLAAPIWIAVVDIALCKRRNMEVVQPYLTLAYQREGISELRVVITKRTHLGARELYPRFECFQDLVVMECLAVLRDWLRSFFGHRLTICKRS